MDLLSQGDSHFGSLIPVNSGSYFLIIDRAPWFISQVENKSYIIDLEICTHSSYLYTNFITGTYALSSTAIIRTNTYQTGLNVSVECLSNRWGNRISSLAYLLLSGVETVFLGSGWGKLSLSGSLPPFFLSLVPTFLRGEDLWWHISILSVQMPARDFSPSPPGQAPQIHVLFNHNTSSSGFKPWNNILFSFQKPKEKTTTKIKHIHSFIHSHNEEYF